MAVGSPGAACVGCAVGVGATVAQVAALDLGCARVAGDTVAAGIPAPDTGAEVPLASVTASAAPSAGVREGITAVPCAAAVGAAFCAAAGAGGTGVDVDNAAR